MGSKQGNQDRAFAVLAVLMELLEERSQETGNNETQLACADIKIAARLGYRSTSVVRTALGELAAQGRISKYTSPLSGVIVTLIETSGASPQQGLAPSSVLEVPTDVSELAERRMQEVQRLTALVERLNREKDELTGQHGVLQSKLSTANNRANKTARELRDEKEARQAAEGKVRKLNQEQKRLEEALKLLREESAATIARLEAELQAAQAHSTPEVITDALAKRVSQIIST